MVIEVKYTKTLLSFLQEKEKLRVVIIVLIGFCLFLQGKYQFDGSCFLFHKATRQDCSRKRLKTSHWNDIKNNREKPMTGAQRDLPHKDISKDKTKLFDLCFRQLTKFSLASSNLLITEF